MQVQAQDAGSTVSKQLDPRFQEGVDAISMLDGSTGTDDYLMAWEWGEYVDTVGSAESGGGVAGRATQQWISEGLCFPHTGPA